jgi:1,4-alpha-glucan branching enzyme
VETIALSICAPRDCCVSRAPGTSDWRPHARVEPAEAGVEPLSRAGSWAPFSDRSGLEPEANGYFSGVVRARAGDRYRFQLDNSSPVYPDPASRFQPCGPHQASAVVDSLHMIGAMRAGRACRWKDK